MKAKKIRAWAVVSSVGEVVASAPLRDWSIGVCASKNTTGPYPPYTVVPLTGTFTPPKRKGALAAVRGKK